MSALIGNGLFVVLYYILKEAYGVLIKNSTMKQESDQEIIIPVDGLRLPGLLTIPVNAGGLVIFSHGSGSSRFSPRNKYVAEVLNNNRIATLLTDLLTPQEESVYNNRFNIALLTDRLAAVAKWVLKEPDVSHLPLGFFGASTGAASALKASVLLKENIKAVVCRGGRPDMAEEALPMVQTPVLLLVGSQDDQVIELNRQAFEKLPGKKEMTIISGASHLFEEPGKLEEVAKQATRWFGHYLEKKEVLNNIIHP
jgi:dienelactone hydrolase